MTNTIFNSLSKRQATSFVGVDIEQLVNSHRGDDQAYGELLEVVLDVWRSMRGELERKDSEIARLTSESTAMSQAQADAIVKSAEIIDELEVTRERLANAHEAAERAAKDTQRLADTVFEKTHDGILVFHSDRCIACNDNAGKLLGLPRKEIVGAFPDCFQSAELSDGTSIAESLRCASGADEPRQVESVEVSIGSPSEELWLEIVINPFEMMGEAHSLVVVRDVSSRKQYEAALKKHRDFLSGIVNAVPDQLSVKHAASDELVVANDAFCDLHGVDRQSITGTQELQLFPERCREQISQLEQSLRRGESRGASEIFMQLSDGSRRVLSVNRSLFFSDSEGDEYVISTSRDVTDERVRNDRLRLLASVFQGASEGVAILSADGIVQEANPAFARMFDEHEPFIGRSFGSLLEFKSEIETDLFRCVRRGSSWSGKASSSGPKSQAKSFWISLNLSTEVADSPPQIIALVSDISELEQAQGELKLQAHHDSLTGLPNRLSFKKCVSNLIQQSQKAPLEFAVCFLDLDDFKHVNDTHGHAVGDELLQKVGKRLQAAFGNRATVARFGGDEFAVLLTGEASRPDRLSQSLERLFDQFRLAFQLQQTEALVGVSVGVTHFPEHATDLTALMCNADIAMYEAKCSGKNHARTFDSQMQDAVETRHQVQTKLKRALREGEIELWYQPKICARTQQPKGCEALARWRTAEGEFISPGKFIPIAEQNGLIIPLGLEVVALAAKQACDWRENGIEPDIAINISPQQLRHPRFFQQLTDVLRRHGAEPQWFELEITEHAVMSDVALATATIKDLTNAGFRVGIDDFGTGYSSLSYLKNFEIHTLKIDLSFVRDLTVDSRADAIIRSIISLGAGLDLNVVAEGVETSDQANRLKDLGCDILQGYFFGRPMPCCEFETWLTDGVSNNATVSFATGNWGNATRGNATLNQ